MNTPGTPPTHPLNPHRPASGAPLAVRGERSNGACDSPDAGGAPSNRGWLRFALVGLVAWAAGGAVAWGQCQPDPRRDLWLVSGPVHAVLLTNHTAYLGGGFSYAGPQTGPAAVFDLASGDSAGGLPRIGGSVYGAISDGNGGWFLAGQFTTVEDQSITNLVHLLPDRTVDPLWRTQVTGSYAQTLCVQDGRLYVGGSFQRVGSVARRSLAAIRVSDGGVEPWDPGLTGAAYCLTAANGVIYVGGLFSKVGALARENLAAVDPATGLATDWKPDADQAVRAIGVYGTTVYVGGQFTAVGGKPRNRLAALDATSGAASTWSPNPNGTVRALAVTDAAVYVGGDFTTISVQNRRGLAAVRRSNAAGLPLDFAITSEGTPQVRAIQLAGDALYVAGWFLEVQGERRPLVAAADLATGDPLPAPLGTPYNGSQSDASAYGLATNASQILIAGAFQSLGGVRCTNTVALSTATGGVLPWKVAASAPVRALARRGDAVYVGGSFTNLNGAAVKALAAVDASTGELLADWDAGLTNRNAAPLVRTLLVDGDRLFLGGEFTGAGTTPARLLAAVDALTGDPLLFDARLQGGATVTTLARAGDWLYVGGDFTSAGGVAAARLAAVDAATGAAVNWTPAPNRIVNTLSVVADRLYVGGEFTRINALDLRNLAVFSIPEHELLPWDPALPGTADGIGAIAALDTGVYIAGAFGSIGGEFRDRVAMLGPWTAQAVDWNPAPSAAPGLIGLSDDVVCLGGSFRTVGTGARMRPIGYFAAYRRAPVITKCRAEGATFVIESTSGDRNVAVLHRSPNLTHWERVATNDVPGFSWTVEQPVTAGAGAFYRVSAE